MENRFEEERITNKIAKIAANKGMKNVFTKWWIGTIYQETGEERQIMTTSKEIVDKEATNVEQQTLITYHQLINWVFKSLELLDNEEPVYCPITWIKEWYNLLKDCPLKYEFKGRLLEWFKSTHNVNIMVRPSIEEDYYGKYEVDVYLMNDYATLLKTFIDNATRKKVPVLYDSEEKAEHEAILYVFKQLLYINKKNK